jgi:tRNA pseudouridine38-40 synthase
VPPASTSSPQPSSHRSSRETDLGVRRGPPPEWKRLKFTLAYCGTAWSGWQSQENAESIQDQVEKAILKATGATTRIHGSGRTDAGVHALGQVAHGDVPESLRMSPQTWAHALNACLPLSIRVLSVQEVPGSFHARFDALGKTYRYRIWRPRLLSPFESDRSWHVYGPFDMAAVQSCLDGLTGTRNFARLSANRGDLPETERRLRPEKIIRTLHTAEMQECGEVLEFTFTGEGFLYKMVRMITGSLIHVARRRSSADWFHSLLADPTGPQTTQTAPACGLYLTEVRY